MNERPADPYGTRAQVDVIAREAYCPAEIHLLAGLGHAPHLETPETVGLIARFVRHIAAIDRLGRPAGRTTSGA